MKKYLKFQKKQKNISQLQENNQITYEDFLLKGNNIINKKTQIFFMPRERSIDIDSPIDFAIARFLMENPNKYGEIST